MNNREKRLDYIKNTFNLTLGNYCEECFISSVINNKFAMDFIKREIDKLDNFESVLNFNLRNISNLYNGIF